ncbi:hypothetical protein K438DRAFT_1973643 [Mycena galopus ATCC 62051]|nr:hypothetical protein K438DRAFT_1973643 [Mycena galopus ATCC 62051]
MPDVVSPCGVRALAKELSVCRSCVGLRTDGCTLPGGCFGAWARDEAVVHAVYLYRAVALSLSLPFSVNASALFATPCPTSGPEASPSPTSLLKARVTLSSNNTSITTNGDFDNLVAAVPANGDFSAVVGSLTDPVCGLLLGVGGSCADIGAGCMAGLQSVIWVGFPLLLCCYPRACTAPLRFRLGPSDPRLARRTLMRFPRVCSSSLCSFIYPPTPRPPRDRPPSTSRPCPRFPPPPSPRALPRASSFAAPSPPASLLVVLPWPSPSFRFPILSRFLLPSYSRASSSLLCRHYALLLALFPYPR